jgi:phage terminase large subunit GpA-like protein
MKIPRPGPGYMHLPDWATDEYLEQLTGERKITVRGRRTRVRKPLYVKTSLVMRHWI